MDDMNWMAWASRIDNPRVIRLMTPRLNALLHALVPLCQEMWEGHQVIGHVHDEGVHSVCDVIKRRHADLLKMMQDLIEAEVRHSEFLSEFVLNYAHLDSDAYLATAQGQGAVRRCTET